MAYSHYIDYGLHPEICDTPNPIVYEKRGNVVVRLATDEMEVRAAQALRYQVFFEQLSARPTLKQRLTRLDVDGYDKLCDHLIVTTRDDVSDVTPLARLKTGETVVGCYRLLHGTAAERGPGFYSASEFDLSAMLSLAGAGLNILELGRSCVAPSFRAKQTVDLLWSGLGAYINYYSIDALMGCASFAGIDAQALAQPLSLLHHTRRTPEQWYVRALPERYVDMNQIPEDEIDFRSALRSIPPVLRGYYRAGCYIGDGAVIDHDFSTVDVFVLLPMHVLADRYRERYTN